MTKNKELFNKVRDSTQKKYFAAVNMTLKEFKDWSLNPCSRKASLDCSPVKRTLRLLSRPKSKWTNLDIRWALKSISFISRMRKVRAGKKLPDCGLSKRSISLMNWGFNPNK